MKALNIALLALSVGCGEARPRLPPPLPPPGAGWRGPGDAGRGRALMRDRRVGRSGYACGDCHRLVGDAPARLRPAPSLVTLGAGPWWSGLAPSVAIAVDLCVERYLARPALAPGPLGDLVAATATATAVSRAGRTFRSPPAALLGDARRGAALYDQACRHCHEDGPAGALLTRPWRPSAIAARIRGDGRGAHPAHLALMPRWPVEAIDDQATADLATWVADAARIGDTARAQ